LAAKLPARIGVLPISCSNSILSSAPESNRNSLLLILRLTRGGCYNKNIGETTFTLALAFAIGYARGELLENIYKIIIKKPAAV